MRDDMQNDTFTWRYCVVGNIVKTHIDENGTLRYGTVAYSGGTKVYLCGRLWERGREKISVLGKNRFNRYEITEVSPKLIENVRCKRVFRPHILWFMNNWECTDLWWNNAPEEKTKTEEFVRQWNS